MAIRHQNCNEATSRPLVGLKMTMTPKEKVIAFSDHVVGGEESALNIIKENQLELSFVCFP